MKKVEPESTLYQVFLLKNKNKFWPQYGGTERRQNYAKNNSTGISDRNQVKK